MTQNCSSVGLLDRVWGHGRGKYVPSLILVGLGELDLDSVDAVYAVDEEDQDEDERDLHAIL